MSHQTDHWTLCSACEGLGKKSRRLRKKVKLRYQRELKQYEDSDQTGPVPVLPKRHLDICLNCQGSGLVAATKESAIELTTKSATPDYPHLAIIGGGIGGVALSVACKHRNIPFTLYERDSGFDARSQGYGLTLQQASKAIEGLGIFSLQEGVVSTRHVVHSTDGKVIGDWGVRNMEIAADKAPPKRTNVHIARQSLRAQLLEQLGDDKVQWGHQLQDIKTNESGGVDLTFEINGENKTAQADLVVGADGIRSTVRKVLMGEESFPLRYLDCIVILGICSLKDINAGPIHDNHTETHDLLLDSATVFQTANGNERIYVMPYDADSVMWQLSFPMPEADAQALSALGPQALKEEAIRRCQWHDPIPQILSATQATLVSGYPVYDRALLKPETLAKQDHATLLGDAAHPMSPFKGQGANQALLDALSLAREITKGCRPSSQWRQIGLRPSVLEEFESDMLQRSASKVQGSAEAAQFLHSDVVLHEGNEPRGRVLLRDEKHNS